MYKSLNEPVPVYKLAKHFEGRDGLGSNHVFRTLLNIGQTTARLARGHIYKALAATKSFVRPPVINGVYGAKQ
jgi:hypothetical protein